ncbi:hypothetical protein FN846DRAFT_806559 [Sphaerosporella brunnea]|uniref:HECT-type E3 ubiquitin transferase n=1 Tax=Sphaerosporella brunnea TaxID=1250544 RepID=A0A5J5FAG0_9PEZI|nr:hypothetical protein FN846DRAFT_806559 [Sphaerosporella brunnea]
MFNFTGSGRRPRNVNLSGKKSTPTTTTSGASLLRNKPTPSSSLQAARDERAAREAERRRLKAAEVIQRTWRGRRDAERQRDIWRSALDQAISLDVDQAPSLMSLFLGIAGMGRRKGRRQWSKGDLERLDKMIAVIRTWLLGKEKKPDPKRNRYLRRKFGRLLVEAIDGGVVQNETLEKALQSLAQLSWHAPEISNEEYYSALSKITVSAAWNDTLLQALIEALANPLLPAKYGEPKRATDVDAAYGAFDATYLVTPNLVSLLGDRAIKKLVSEIDLRKVTSCCSMEVSTDSKLWLLSHIIYFTRHDKRAVDLTDGMSPKLSAAQEEYINFVSTVLSSVAVEVGQRIDVEDHAMKDQDQESEDEDEDEGLPSRQPGNQKEPLPVFVKEQIESLIQQSTVTSLLSSTKSTGGDVQVLSGFALTLLLVFPAKRTDMRFWLCVALTSDGVPAVKYVWNAVKKCRLFSHIKADAIAAIDYLKYPPVPRGGVSAKSVEEQWNLIFLFLEMYSFVLVTGDDHEFLQGKGRQLALSEVSELALFLKNLAFAMYWWFAELMGEDRTKDNGAEVYFKTTETGRVWELGYFRSVVTDVLKAIYTRDSRRHFLPNGYWLMQKYLTLDGFIAAVVQEEDNRQQQLAAEAASDDEEDSRADRDSWISLDASTRRHLDLARREKARRKKQRMNFLGAIAPRSEIVQNLPFMIPFDKRVEIFREFVAKDQHKRREGFVDPDQWRFSLNNGRAGGREALAKHHATIRRQHEFEDAYKAFWQLEAGLKEPIQITFVDKFGAEEAGIDGGGVTKEFLTGVCGEAFSPSADVTDEDSIPEEYDEWIYPMRKHKKSMFKENPEHLLYPNPTLLEEMKYTAQLWEADPKPYLSDILSRYEFCGRILGKCLYEGILVDLSFAPFFLLRWSQPATASAVGVNDLRDLDAEVYRHLMALMDFEGDVESTFGLDFTITTQIAPGRVETYNLKPGGDSIPVTNPNRLEYVHLVSKHRLVKEPALQTAAFLRGLTTIINPNWLKMFNQSELQTLVGGDVGNPIDVEDLRRNTIYGGVYEIGDDGEEHESIKLFWQVMHELDDSDRRKVLRFVTSVSRAPLLGFKVLSPRFCIRDAGDDQTRLCSASTCVNLLKMPRYKDRKTLKEKLLYSVRSNAGFDLS